jgi:hypothetical protein
VYRFMWAFLQIGSGHWKTLTILILVLWDFLSAEKPLVSLYSVHFLFIKNYLLDGVILPDKSTLKRETILNTNNKVNKEVYNCSYVDTPWLTAGSPEAKSFTHQGSLCLWYQMAVCMKWGHDKSQLDIRHWGSCEIYLNVHWPNK